MTINFGQPTESQTIAARNTSSRDNQLALAKLLEGETVSGLTASAVGIKRLNNGVLEHLTNHSPETWAEKALAYAKSASPAFTGIPTAPTAAADTNTTQLATTAFVVGQAGGAAPLVNGTAAAGTSLRYARQDHVHPTDTSRAPLASPNFSGTPQVSGSNIWHAGNFNPNNYAPLASPNFSGTPQIASAVIATQSWVSSQDYLTSSSGLNASNLTAGTVPDERLARPVRAWVHFSLSAGTPTINAQSNVSGITRNAQGDYTITFASALPSGNYTVMWCAQRDSGGAEGTGTVVINIKRNPGVQAAGSCRIFIIDLAINGVDTLTSCQLTFVGG